jgi:hypothetical protein
MLHQDLLGYALLGDPAVRLPLAGRAAGAAQAHRAAAPATATTSASIAVAAAGSALDRLEQAALAVAGGASPGAIAADLGLPRSEIAEAAEVYRAAGRAALTALLETQDKGRDR